jgi:hypothetical protein
MAHQNIYGGDELLEPDKHPVTNKSATADQIVEDQWKAYTRARDAGHLDWVEEARGFDDYYYGDQWDTDTKSTLDSEGRPYHTVNLVLSTVNAVTGEYIKSRQDISFAPMGKGANQETATALRYLFKQIATNNKTEHIEKMMFMDGLIQDRGYMYYYMDFSDNLDGEVREEAMDPTDVILDAGAKDYDPRTWSEAFISRWMTPDEIGALYGLEHREKVELAAANGTFGHDSLEWEAPTFSGERYDSEVFFEASGEEVKRVKRIRVIERQYRKLARTAFFVDRKEGDMRRVPEGWDLDKVKAFAEINELGLMWKPERRIRVTITADKILLHDKWSLFDQISIIPFFPYFRRGRPFGVVRNLVSIQDMLNKVSSQELHVVNTTANSGWIFQQGSLVNMDSDDLRSQGSKTGLVLEIAQGYEPPAKIQPNQIPTGLSEISSKAGIYFREVSGVNEAQLGIGRSDSSKALESRRRGGLIQQEIVFDNLELTRKLRSEIILEAVQRYYTETRLINILEKNEDGDDEQIELAVNQPVVEVDPETQEAIETIRNDLTIGEYSTTVTTVPRRDTYEEALFDQLMQMREAGVRIPDYVLVEASQLPDKKDVVEVIKKMEGLAAPTEEEMERARALADLELRLLTAEVAEKEAQAAERQANAQRYQAQAGAELQKPEVEKLRIGTEARTKMEGMGMQYQSNQEDLMTRIRIAQGKEGTMRDIAKIESMTRRNEAGMKRAASLQDSLMTIRDKARDRAAGAAEKAAKKE